MAGRQQEWEGTSYSEFGVQAPQRGPTQNFTILLYFADFVIRSIMVSDVKYFTVFFSKNWPI